MSQWQDRRQRRGVRGELVAMEFLVSLGWEVEAHRFRLGRHDLDLVVRQGQLIAFVEVKTRRSNACGSAIESVSAFKQRKLGRIATYWRVRYGRPGDVYRFDVVAVQDRGGGRWEVDRVADAWRLEWSVC
jgi:putative endonuclease